ncbi:hypothetical protein MNBD_PLANCTO02-1165 [hydrothermal vent metagenome]|uniref:Uncharacterized protein n=1 Tax=hydrothermal vent metagenome TaxID=652676 RepID=A0A3B1DVL7_9ZZZZ
MFVAGIAAAFGRAGNGSDYLAKTGLLLLASSGGLTLTAAIIGLTNFIRTRRFNW